MSVSFQCGEPVLCSVSDKQGEAAVPVGRRGDSRQAGI